MATLIRTDGTTRRVDPKNAAMGFTLKELYEWLNCSTVKIVRIPNGNDGKFLVVDEDGLMRQREFNQEASILALRSIVGLALVCRPEELR